MLPDGTDAGQTLGDVLVHVPGFTPLSHFPSEQTSRVRHSGNGDAPNEQSKRSSVQAELRFGADDGHIEPPPAVPPLPAVLPPVPLLPPEPDLPPVAPPLPPWPPGASPVPAASEPAPPLSGSSPAPARSQPFAPACPLAPPLF